MSTGDRDEWNPEDDQRGRQMLALVEDGARLREIIIASREVWGAASRVD